MKNGQYSKGDKSFKQAIKFLEEALMDQLPSSQENQVRLCLGISKYYDGKAKKAIEILAFVLQQGKLDDKQQAEAHFYWGMSKLATGERQDAREKFEKALQLNPNLKLPPWLEQARDLLEEARKAVTGTLEHEPPQSAASDQEIPLTFHMSHNKPRQVNVYYRKTSERKFTAKRPVKRPMPSSGRVDL